MRVRAIYFSMSLSMQNRLKSKSVSVQWYRTLRDNRLTLVIYSQMTIEAYSSNGHQSGKMAFRFYQHRFQLFEIKDLHIHDQILICVKRPNADRRNHGSHSQNAK